MHIAKSHKTKTGMVVELRVKSKLRPGYGDICVNHRWNDEEPYGLGEVQYDDMEEAERGFLKAIKFWEAHEDPDTRSIEVEDKHLAEMKKESTFETLREANEE